jgi:protein TonB
MKINSLKISKMAWISAVCVMLFSTSCEITPEEEIEGPTQVESKPGIGPTDITARINDVGKDNKEIFDVSEVQPNPPGGMEGWNNYLASNLKYPAEAKSMGIEGTVIVVFVVNSDGSVSDTEILRGIGGGADQEAVRVVSASPNWTPAQQKGQVVNSRMRLPVKFQLSSKEVSKTL